MTLAVQIVWWIGLLGALAATLAILKLVALVLRSSSDVLACARIARRAARGIATHLEPVAAMDGLAAPAEEVRRGATELAHAVDRLHGSLAVAGNAPRTEGG